ncbi:MAG: hypothetical protein GY842_29245 [bacterium]|nr:hypothetical protein [bacterium]
MSKRKKRLLGASGFLLALLIVWLVINPPGSFGWCRFALTTYGGVPHLISDIQLREDGEVRHIEKTHDLKLSDVVWLLEPCPDVLIIANGWQERVQIGDDITGLDQCTVEVLSTGDAVRRYRELRRQGKRVAIHVHSTC